MARRVFLVRHGRPLVDPNVPAGQWRLDPAGLSDPAWDRVRDRLPHRAHWVCSPEPKAVETVARLTDRSATVVPDLREQVRLQVGLVPDFELVLARAFAHPARPAYDGWESVDVTRARAVSALRRVLAENPDDDIVVVGHGTVTALLVADLTGSPPDPDLPGRLGMPDVVVIEMPEHRRPVSPMVAGVVALVVAFLELFTTHLTGRFGWGTGVALALAGVATVPTRTRAYGLAGLAGAVIGSFIAVIAGNSVIPS